MPDLHVTGEAVIPATQEGELMEWISNYVKLCGIEYSAAFQEFKEELRDLYEVDISKLEGSGTDYEKIVSNGLFDKAREVIITLIWSKSNNPTVVQLADVISQLSFHNDTYKDLIGSDPNYTVIDGIPYKRVVKRFTKEQMDAINEYANNHGINPAEAIYELLN